MKELAYSWGSLSTLEMGGKPTPDRGKGEVSEAAGGELKEYQIFACLLNAPAAFLRACHINYSLLSFLVFCRSVLCVALPRILSA